MAIQHGGFDIIVKQVAVFYRFFPAATPKIQSNYPGKGMGIGRGLFYFAV